ncbi:phosphonopyruvate decarboxylase [Phreatobacter stygius]|uniref:Phosphonopyruvate decarboxylase n=2 Tax=Phreatobacter stygius TaxID=1940610 RepID=A0A4D7BNE3_9HYPH|nr:phosphonopyruvate decarboxylase [Phreatobacter stygius]
MTAQDVPVTGADGSAGATIRQGWPDDIFDCLREFGVRQVPYVPDGGHARLISRVHQEPSMRGIALTSEQEGIAVAAGAWLGGQRAALLMQSSGVGNCVNMLSLIKICKFPLLMLVTMRGEWGEFNPWQVPMGSTTPDALRLMDVQVQRADRPDEVGDVVRHAATMAYGGGSAMAVLLSQRLVGAKVFTR